MTLTATATSGSFTGWSGGGCSGTGTCVVTMSSSQSVTATFTGDSPGVTPCMPITTINNSVDTLIYHYYSCILNRSPEASGLSYYENKVAQAQAQGDVKPAFRQIGYDFFNSPEYLGRQTSDNAYITTLYNTFLLRVSESSGLQYYLNRLSNGESRNQFITDFTNSPEFANLMRSLGF